MRNTPVIPTRSTNLNGATLSLDLRGRKLASALVNHEGDIIAESYRDFDGATARTLATAMATAIIELATDRKRGESHINAIGISARHAYMTGLEELLSRELSRHGLDIRRPAGSRHARADKDVLPHPPVSVNSRQIAAVAGEAWVGAAKGRRNAAVLTLGDVIEAGLMIDGKIVRGTSGHAGSIGWFALSETWRDEFAASGCLNIESGRQCLIRRAVESWSGSSESLLTKMNSSDLTPEIVIRAARAGDEFATGVINDVLSWIGRAVADLISMLNPEIVVLRGDLGLELRPFLPELRKIARKWSQPDAFKDCRIAVSTLGPRGVLIGAARLAMVS